MSPQEFENRPSEFGLHWARGRGAGTRCEEDAEARCGNAQGPGVRTVVTRPRRGEASRGSPQGLHPVLRAAARLAPGPTEPLGSAVRHRADALPKD